MHGQGTFTSATGWSYTGALERDRPTQGVLREADGRRFDVTYARDCAEILKNPTPRTKVSASSCYPPFARTARVAACRLLLR